MAAQPGAPHPGCAPCHCRCESIWLLCSVCVPVGLLCGALSCLLSVFAFCGIAGPSQPLSEANKSACQLVCIIWQVHPGERVGHVLQQWAAIHYQHSDKTLNWKLLAIPEQFVFCASIALLSSVNTVHTLLLARSNIGALFVPARSARRL